MAAPTKPCYVKILLANPEPSTHGTSVDSLLGKLEGVNSCGRISNERLLAMPGDYALGLSRLSSRAKASPMVVTAIRVSSADRSELSSVSFG